MDLVVLRDLALIVLAVLAIIDAIIFLVVGLLLYGVIKSTKGKLDPILDMVQDTVGNVRGTSSFVSDLVVKPIIGVASFAAGVRRAAGVATGFARRRGGSTNEQQ
jgi:hypothetical protein